MTENVEPPTGGNTIRVGVADKSPLVQAALEHLFSRDELFELVTVCSDGEALLRSLDEQPLDVVVSGWVIGPGGGQYILDSLRNRADAPKVVVYTGAAETSVPAKVMAHGGAAFVSKSDDPARLLETVAAVASGKMVFPFLDVRAINNNPLHSLTRRELEVLSALATGHSNKQIAAAQGVSPNTIKFHVKNVFQKLGVKNRAQAVALYLKS